MRVQDERASESEYRQSDDSYSKALQNGFMTRNEVRRLENLPVVDGADALTAQNNLVPLDKLGEQKNTSQTPLGEPIKQ